MKTAVVAIVLAFLAWRWIRGMIASSEGVAIPDGSSLPGIRRNAPVRSSSRRCDDPMGDDQWDPIGTGVRGRPHVFLDRRAHYTHADGE